MGGSSKIVKLKVAFSTRYNAQTTSFLERRVSGHKSSKEAMQYATAAACMGLFGFIANSYFLHS